MDDPIRRRPLDDSFASSSSNDGKVSRASPDRFVPRKRMPGESFLGDSFTAAAASETITSPASAVSGGRSFRPIKQLSMIQRLVLRIFLSNVSKEATLEEAKTNQILGGDRAERHMAGLSDEVKNKLKRIYVRAVLDKEDVPSVVDKISKKPQGLLQRLLSRWGASLVGEILADSITEAREMPTSPTSPSVIRKEDPLLQASKYLEREFKREIERAYELLANQKDFKAALKDCRIDMIRDHIIVLAITEQVDIETDKELYDLVQQSIDSGNYDELDVFLFFRLPMVKALVQQQALEDLVNTYLEQNSSKKESFLKAAELVTDEGATIDELKKALKSLNLRGGDLPLEGLLKMQPDLFKNILERLADTPEDKKDLVLFSLIVPFIWKKWPPEE